MNDELESSGQSNDEQPLADSSTALREAAPSNQMDFDIDFYDAILRRAPDYVDVLRCQGGLLARKGLVERSLAIDQRLVKLAPGDYVARYNLACNLAQAGQTRHALSELRRALELGYRDFRYLTMDADLDALRDHPEYTALAAEFGFDAHD